MSAVEPDQPALTVAEEPASQTTTTSATSPAATSPAATSPAATSPAQELDETVVTTIAPAPSAVAEPIVVREGPSVPPVTLELDDGSTFVSTEATRPVLYVFWAEW